MPDFLVRRGDLRECRIADSEPAGLEPGQALLRVDAFGLTSNNVTYAVLGDAMSYWDFFPAPAGWGRLPVWGFAEVEESRADGVEPGARCFGYLPPSSRLVVTPAAADDRGFTDASPHRAELPPTYQRYLATATDPFYAPDTEAVQVLARGLFFTSFLIDDQLADDGNVDRGPVVISSASAKTAIAAAYLLARRDGAEVIGLTSPRNAEFVAGLGIYDRTVPYDAIDSLDRRPASFLDVAGDDGVRLAVHTHFGDELIQSLGVGMTHWEQFGTGAGALPGPDPAFFFAPTRFAKRSEDWGAGGLEARAAEAWHPFCEWMSGWLRLDAEQGFDAVRAAYLDVLEGRVDPRSARVLMPEG
jgi:hypothetical protein